MGCYDVIDIPCPRCGQAQEAQSKGGPCAFITYDLDTAPLDVLSDVNRHAPFICPKCQTVFEVAVKAVATTRVVMTGKARPWEKS